MPSAHSSNIDECGICKDSVWDLNDAIRATSCAHVFHSDCLYNHLRESETIQQGASCPTCNTESRFFTTMRVFELNLKSELYPNLFAAGDPSRGDYCLLSENINISNARDHGLLANSEKILVDSEKILAEALDLKEKLGERHQQASLHSSELTQDQRENAGKWYRSSNDTATETVLRWLLLALLAVLAVGALWLVAPYSALVVWNIWQVTTWPLRIVWIALTRIIRVLDPRRIVTIGEGVFMIDWGNLLMAVGLCVTLWAINQAIITIYLLFYLGRGA